MSRIFVLGLLALLPLGAFVLSPISTGNAHSASCPSDARYASRAIWPKGTIETGKQVTGRHPCGAHLKCIGGTQSIKRRCSWLAGS